jgi:hypothetical protein
VRRAPSVLLRTRTRLACVKHAASVRSEPGSNSRVKLAAWKTKKPDSHFWMSDRLRGELQTQRAPKFSKRTFLSLDSLTHPSRSRVQGKSNGFWHISSLFSSHSICEPYPVCQRAFTPCPAGGLPSNPATIASEFEMSRIRGAPSSILQQAGVSKSRNLSMQSDKDHS